MKIKHKCKCRTESYVTKIVINLSQNLLKSLFLCALVIMRFNAKRELNILATFSMQ